MFVFLCTLATLVCVCENTLRSCMSLRSRVSVCLFVFLYPLASLVCVFVHTRYARVDMDPILAKIVCAAKLGDAEQVVSIAKSNPFIAPSVSIEPALLAACEYGQLAVVRACVSQLRGNVNCVDSSGRSPLHLSVAKSGNGKIAISIIRYLVGCGAYIRKSVLHVCANDFAVFPLIELKADVDAKSVDGLAPIAVAVAADRSAVVAELLRANCRLPEGIILKAKSPSVVCDLVRHRADINARDSKGRTALQLAVAANDQRLARALLESAINTTQTPGLQHHIDAINVLLDSNTEGLEWEKLEASLAATLAKAQVLRARAVVAASATSTASSTPTNHSLCTICKSGPKCVVLMPCRHFCVCETCSQALKNGSTWDDDKQLCNTQPTCPICRAIIADYVSVYTS